MFVALNQRDYRDFHANHAHKLRQPYAASHERNSQIRSITRYQSQRLIASTVAIDEETNFIVGAPLRRYIEVVNAHPTIVRLLTAIILSALAGGLAYGVTIWLAPDSRPAILVALIVAAISALGALWPRTTLNALGHKNNQRSKPPETYYDLDYSLKKNSSWED